MTEALIFILFITMFIYLTIDNVRVRLKNKKLALSVLQERIDKNIIIECDSIQVNKVIDLTGAGDLFAAGFLKEYIEKSEIKKCLTTGSLMASKIIQKIGARIE
jgi:fructokinase